MTKSEIKEKLWIMENFCNGKSANVGRNEVLGNDEQSDFYAEGIERKPYKGVDALNGTNKLGSGKYVYIEEVLEILNKLIESEDKE